MTFPRWLRPWHPASGAAFGYLFGYVTWLALLITFTVYRGSLPSALQFVYGFAWAVPWSVLWCVSGALCQDEWRYPGTVVTALGIASGTTYSLTTGTLGGWQALTIPVYSGLHCVGWHLVMLPVWMFVWWIRGGEMDDDLSGG